MNFKTTLFFLLFAIISICYEVVAFSKDAKELPIPDELHAALTIERGFLGLYVQNDFILAFPSKSQFFVRIPVHFDGKTREERFGKLTDQVRIPLQEAKYPGDWRGAFMTLDRLLVWDASMMQLLMLRLKDFKTVLSTTVPADLLKPARDRMGEPTAVETARTRASFKAAATKIFGSKYTSISEIPSNWIHSKGRSFFISTKIPGFPLLAMACQAEDISVCKIERQCFLESGPKILPESIIGLGVSQKSREILLARADTNEIEVYKFNSCFDITWKRTLRLPKRLPKVSNIYVDASNRLWMTSLITDSYTDSNLVYWDSETWSRE